jgi:predicted MFS family arabinose efflux permease
MAAPTHHRVPAPEAGGHAGSARGVTPGVGLSVVLLGAGAGYGGGNVGPVTGAIGRAFGVSLSTVGLTMTVFFAAIAIVTVGSAFVLRRLGPRAVLVLCCLLAGAGNLLCAASPWFGGVLAGRALAGLGAGLAFVIGPVLARANGGARLVGAFGAAVTLGIAVALALGSVLADAGVNWRVGFAISAGIGLAALPFLPRRVSAGTSPGTRTPGFMRVALRTTALWRLMLLFIHANGITIVVSTWMIEYLVVRGGNRPWLAGALGFVLFVVTAIVRRISGRFVGGGAGRQRLAAASPLLTAAGLAGLALDADAGAALAWVILMGAGFALPYALMIDRAQRLFPRSPAEVIAFLQTGPNVVPMAVVPLIGAALDSGHGPAAFLSLAGFVVLVAVANAGPWSR